MTPLFTPYFLDQIRSGYAPSIEGFEVETNPAALDTDQTEVQRRVLPLYREIQSYVKRTAEKSELSLTLNGDCLMTIPVWAGLKDAGLEPLLIWFDAHGDFNTWETTPSQFLGGMPLAMIAGKGELTILEALNGPIMPESDIILTDGRDLDPEEGILVAESDLIHLTDVGALLDYPLPNRPIWVHFDSDVMRLSDVPAVSYPAEGGPSLEVVEQVFDHLKATGNIVSVSTTLPNPELDPDGASGRCVNRLLKRLI